MTSICVFCGANKGSRPEYEALTRQLGQSLVRRGLRAVYGAGRVGLMGVLADEVLGAGGAITGVIPDFLKKMEVCHLGLTELIEVETMHQRKQIMAQISDGFFVLPGGYGTLDEFFEILTWKQLNLHQKPIGLFNHAGYYDHLVAHMDTMVREGFLRQENRELVIVENDLEKLLDRMQQYQPGRSAEKWLDRT